MNDPLGQAIHDLHFESTPAKLWIDNRYADAEEMPVEIFFRDHADMPELEHLALAECTGDILDIGAGAGSHALELQRLGARVTALEISELSCQVMEDRGVNSVTCDSVFNPRVEKFDTLLLLMNGIGLAGDLAGLGKLLDRFEGLLRPGGQVIFDSSDIAYLFGGNRPSAGVGGDSYYGVVPYRYRYRNLRGAWFNWLYIDRITMQREAAARGWRTEVIYQDDQDQYLARLTRIST